MIWLLFYWFLRILLCFKDLIKIQLKCHITNYLFQKEKLDQKGSFVVKFYE